MSKVMGKPLNFGEFLVEYLNMTALSPVIQLNLLTSVTGARGGLHPVSYDFLLETNRSMATFLICNATLRLSDEARNREGKWSWESCQHAVETKFHGSKLLTELNRSPPHEAIDVVGLANLSYLSARARKFNASTSSGCHFTLNAMSPEAIRVAQQMPLVCGGSDAFKFEEDAWFKRTGIQRPVSPRKPVCLVQEEKLTQHHWSLIHTLLPENCWT